jgi:hypothetical protein
MVPFGFIARIFTGTEYLPMEPYSISNTIAISQRRKGRKPRQEEGGMPGKWGIPLSMQTHVLYAVT